MAPEGNATTAVESGDRSPDLSPDGIRRYEAQQSREGAQGSLESALTDIAGRIDSARGGRSNRTSKRRIRQLADGLAAVVDGADPDDLASLRATLLREETVARMKNGNKEDELAANWREGGYPYANRLPRKSYEKQKYDLQVELLKLQRWVKETGSRVVILFEGRDAAGKGGTIKRFMEHLNPRGSRVVALEKPTDIERGQWYFQRYIQHLPTSGGIVLFDRS